MHEVTAFSPGPYSFAEVVELAEYIFVGRMTGKRVVGSYEHHVTNEAGQEYWINLGTVRVIEIEVVEALSNGVDFERAELMGVLTYPLAYGGRPTPISFRQDENVLFFARKNDRGHLFVGLYDMRSADESSVELQSLRVWKAGDYTRKVDEIYAEIKDQLAREKDQLAREKEVKLTLEKQWYDAQMRKLEPIMMEQDHAKRRAGMVALLKEAGFDGFWRPPSRQAPKSESIDWRDKFWRETTERIELIDVVYGPPAQGEAAPRRTIDAGR